MTLYSDKNSKVKRNCYYIPENYTFQTENHEFEAYFLHSMEWQRVLARREKTEFVFLQSKIMQAKCHNYKTHIDTLQEKGIIDINHSYEVGQYSKSFRLTEAFHSTKYRRYETKGIVKADIKYKAPIEKHLANCLKTLSVVDNLGEFSLMAIDDGKLFQTTCDYYRIHTNLTNLKSSFKSQLRLNGSQILQFDFINSQPFFLCLDISNTSTIYNHDSYISNILHTSNTPFHYVRESTDKCFMDNDLGKTDIMTFIDDCCKGRLYDKLAEKMFLDRKTIKKHLYKEIFFGKIKNTWDELTIGTRLREMFSDTYPSVWEYIKQVKAKDYRHLAHRLQRLEAKVVIHQICEAIRQYDKKLTILTIHDSILAPVERGNEVEDIINFELEKLIIKPQIKKELL